MKYIDADKLLDIIIKMQKEYATQEVTEEHKGLRAVLGGQCLVLTEIIEVIDSLQQEQNEDLIQGGKDRAILYANEHAKGKDIWVRDALFVAYISAIQDTLKIRII